ncbi:MAG: hypothetical protein EOL93_00680 [Epsilonproteobacteria bacterium]|nr:hypothetical protein [Campylobacterota bacterium]
MLTLRSKKGSPLTHEEMDANFRNSLLLMSAMYDFSPRQSADIVAYVESEPEGISLPATLQENFVFNDGSSDDMVAIHALPLGLVNFKFDVTFTTIGANANGYLVYIDKSGMLCTKYIESGSSTTLTPLFRFFFILTGSVSPEENSPCQIDYTLTGSSEALA